MSHIIHGEVSQLSPLVRRITAPNPGVMTGPGTNSYLVGHKEVALIDPGPAIESHLDAIEAAINESQGQLRWILCTHTHLDHSPGANPLRQRTGAAVIGMATPNSKNQDGDFNPDEQWAHNSAIETPEFTLKAIHTPGHASNHLCFYLQQEALLFTGDHIMEGSTVVIAPPDGDMKAYLESLEDLKNTELNTLAPAHGNLIEKPLDVINGLIRHRLMRESKTLAGMKKAGPGTIEELTPVVYDDVPSALHPIARYSLQAHLEKLLKENRVAEHNGQWQLP